MVVVVVAVCTESERVLRVGEAEGERGRVFRPVSVRDEERVKPLALAALDAVEAARARSRSVTAEPEPLKPLPAPAKAEFAPSSLVGAALARP